MAGESGEDDETPLWRCVRRRRRLMRCWWRVSAAAEHTRLRYPQRRRRACLPTGSSRPPPPPRPPQPTPPIRVLCTRVRGRLWLAVACGGAGTCGGHGTGRAPDSTGRQAAKGVGWNRQRRGALWAPPIGWPHLWMSQVMKNLSRILTSRRVRRPPGPRRGRIDRRRPPPPWSARGGSTRTRVAAAGAGAPVENAVLEGRDWPSPATCGQPHSRGS